VDVVDIAVFCYCVTLSEYFIVLQLFLTSRHASVRYFLTQWAGKSGNGIMGRFVRREM